MISGCRLFQSLTVFMMWNSFNSIFNWLWLIYLTSFTTEASCYFFFIHFLGYKVIFFILIHIASLCHIYMLVHPSSLIMLLTLFFFHFLLVSNRLCSFLQFYYLVVLIQVPYCLGIFHLCFF